MSILDKFSSKNNLGNTGAPSGAVAKLGYSIGHLIHPDGVSFTPAQLASFAAFLAAAQAATLAEQSKRLFPVLTVQGSTNDTTAPEAKKAPYGDTVEYTENPQIFNYELENLGIGWWANVRKFNGRTDLRVILIDEKALHGELDADGNFQGFEANVTFLQVVPSVKTDYTKYNEKVELKDPTALSDNCHSIEIPAGVSIKNKINGLTDVDLIAGTPALGVVTIQALKSISRQSMYETYADELAKVGAWKITNAATGEAIVPTGVTKNVAAAGWDIAYTQDGVEAIITGATPADLAALAPAVGTASAGGFEFGSVSVTLEQ